MQNNKNIISLFKKGDFNVNNKVEPVKTYNDTLLDKFNALDDNIGKSAVYRWVHNTNNKSYVGSSEDLYRRLKEYYSIYYLKGRVLTSTSCIYRALLEEGYGSFTLEVLEYCNKSILIEREQYYIDLLKPEYNKV